MKRLLPCLLFLGGSFAARAVEFHPISGVSSPTAGSDLWPVSNLIQGPGTGFSADEPHDQLGSGASHRWVTAAPDGFPSDYIAQTGQPALLFDLGEDRALSEISVWGYTTTNANGVSRFSLRFATAAEGPVNVSSSIAYQPVFDVVIDDRPRQSFVFDQVVVARYVQFTCEDNFYANGGNGPPGGGDRVGLGEVAFEDAVANPHPVIEVVAAVDFGNAAAYPGPLTLPLTVANLGGDQALEITAAIVIPNATGSQHFAVAGVPVTIEPGARVELEVTFDSSGAEGCFQARLELESNDPARPSVPVLLNAGLNCTAPEPVKPEFSVAGGTFTRSFDLVLTTATPGAHIVFTTDGSLPGATNGTFYEGPITITASTQVRAATLSGDHEPAVATESYVRLATDVVDYQSGLPIVVVENFGAGAIPDKGWTTGTQTGAGLIQPERQPAYLAVYPTDPGTGRASLTGSAETDSRVGVRVRGAFSSTWDPKPYSLETWKQSGDEGREVSPLGLPKDSDWILYYPHPSYDRTMLYNTFIWELSRQTGRYGTRFRFVDVFVNQDGGDLALADRQGVYALAEKVKRGDDRIDFEALSEDGATGGWLLGINRMDPEPISGFPTENGARSPQFFHTAGPDRILQTPPNSPGQGDDIPRQYNAFINFEHPNGYRINRPQRAAIEGWFDEFENVLYDDQRWRHPELGYRRYLNTSDFIDYFHLLNLAKQGDGLLLSVFPWVSSGERKLHMGPMWDFNNGAYGNSPTSTLYFRADRLWYSRLFDDPDYLREHIDRWYALRRGPLADANMVGIIDRQAASLPLELVTAQGLTAAAWNSRLASMKSYLRTRAAWIDGQFLAPPLFSSDGGIVGSGFLLIMRKPPTTIGWIYYTLDGSDPRSADGSVAPSALRYGEAIALSRSGLVRARTFTDTGEWSALNEATFVVGTPADATNLVVSEIMYHPADPNPLAEFVEVLNIHPDARVDLTGVSFTNGIDFTFPAGTTVAPGERLLVTASRAAFGSVYGAGWPVAGEFGGGTRLANNGERITLSGANGEVIRSFEYNDKPPWPSAADGAGFSLVLIDPESNPDHADAANWRRSSRPGGNPGEARVTKRFAGDPDADLDRDGRSAALEYFYGTSDSDPTDRAAGLSVLVDQAGSLLVSFPHEAGAEDAVGLIEISGDLRQWVPLTTLSEPEVSAEGPPRELWRVGPSDQFRGFVRLRVVIDSAN